MKINSVQNSNPSFNARLNIIPKSVYVKRVGDVTQDLPISELELRLLKNKFQKATKDTEGTLNLSLGEVNYYNQYACKPCSFTYTNGKYKDNIPVIMEPEDVTTKNEFVDKLVKTLEIFKFREKNTIKINDMRKRAAELEQSTKASSLGAMKTMFEMPE